MVDVIVVLARVLFVAYLALIGYCVYRAVHGRPRWYWAAAALIYVMSTAFAWSIGGLTVAGTFLFAGSGLTHIVRNPPRPRATVLGAAAGLAVWAVWLLFGDITWVFWPVGRLLGG